jgi:hypothetical protein
MLLLKPMYRVITFVPPSYLAGVLESIRRIIPLCYGQYDSVAWWSAEGTEQFRPLAGANPAVGKANLLTQLPSVRLEFALPRDPDLLQRVLNDGLIPSHPWEEPVIFVQETQSTRVQVDEDSKGAAP